MSQKAETGKNHLNIQTQLVTVFPELLQLVQYLSIILTLEPSLKSRISYVLF